MACESEWQDPAADKKVDEAWGFVFSKPRPITFLIKKIMHAHSKKKKIFFAKNTKWYNNEKEVSFPLPDLQSSSIFLQRHPTVNSFFCVFPENFNHV